MSSKMAAIDRSLVKTLSFFAELDYGALDDVLQEARVLRHPKNTHVFEQGAEAQWFFVLVQGHVRAEKTTPQGDQIVVRYVSAGEVFGVAPALGLKHYPATAVAVVDSIALAWPTAAWSGLAGKYPQLAMNTLQTVGNRLQDAHAVVMELSTQPVSRRVAHALLRLANQAGRKIDGGVEIDFPVSRQDVAEMTGTTLHTVSRILSEWEARGLVGSGRQRIVLRDLDKLTAIAGPDE
jgi:CRP-like cAMP-binding protein